MAKESGDYRQILKQICQIVKGPVSGEVVATGGDSALGGDDFDRLLAWVERRTASWSDLESIG